MVFNFLLTSWEKTNMKEIAIEHDGQTIHLNQAQVQRLWDIVVEIVGEEE